ncbi:Thymidine phosphorylase [Bienertia sinuspersici]
MPLYLWRRLHYQKAGLRDRKDEAWIIMGDFSCILVMDERLGSSVRANEMAHMRDCILYCGYSVIPYWRKFFTWTNRQNANTMIFLKHDQVMANDLWFNSYEKAMIFFHPEGVSDHNPTVLDANPTFHSGTKMFRVLKKLKNVKYGLKDLNCRGFSNVQPKANGAHAHLLAI